MSPKNTSRLFIAACAALLASSLIAQPAQPEPAPGAPGAAGAGRGGRGAGRGGRGGPPPAAAVAPGAVVEPMYGPGKTPNAPNRDERPISARVPTTAGWRTDWPERLEWDIGNLQVYAAANAKLGAPAAGETRVVFVGDSITENWQRSFNTLYPGKSPETRKPEDVKNGQVINYIGRGRSSETSQQMLLRIRQDVVDLQPKVLVLLAGTNDIAGNLGRQTNKGIQDNLTSIIDIAVLNKIKVVLCTIMPTTRYSWQPSVTDGGARAVAINKWMKEYAATRPGEVFFVDIHTPMVGTDGTSMNPELSGDGTHPNAKGYALISPSVEARINEALAYKEPRKKFLGIF